MKESGKEFSYNMDDIFEYFSNNPKILDINKPINQKIAPISVNTEINWSDFTKAPLVTVYITNHNYEKFIKQSIDSVLSQKFRNFEVIIIDDGSTDKSREIIEQYRNNPKVDIVYQENKGLNVTNNIAIKLSRGKYIMRLDADDYLNENALMILSQKLLGDDSLALVFPDYYLVDENANIIVEEKRHNFQNVTMYDQPAHGACTMIRKDVLIELEGYSEEFTRQDGYEIWVKVIQNKKVSNVGLPLFYYRQHGNSLTKNKEKLYNTRHQIVKKHTEKLDVKNKNHIVIIPIRDKSTNPICLRQFDSTTLLDITIKNILKTDNINQIIVTTPNEIIENYIKNNYKENIIVDLRPSKLARVNIHIEDTVKYVIEKYKISSDTISVVNYEYPLRNSFYIDKAINTLYLFNAKSVMSVTQENANFYLHQGCGLKSFNTNTDLRLERDFIYKESGGIHCIKFDFFKQNSKIISDRSSHIVLDSKASLQVKSEEDFEYLEYLYKKKDL
jgi:glycosyltransferase involved in cell wall biosynthesis